MRVIVPFTHGPGREGQRLQVEEALWQADAVAGGQTVVEWHDVSRTVTSYARLLQRLWGEQEDLTLIEHDVVVHGRVLAEFEGCERGYCAFPYQTGSTIRPALGCTRFRAELLRAVPDALDRVLAIPTSWGAPGHWRQLDVVLLRNVLRDDEGLQPHLHWPAVEHLNPACALEPGATVHDRVEGPALGWAVDR